MTSNRRRGFIWLVIFASIFLLTQDYLFSGFSSKPGILGFPMWLHWFIFVHILFFGVFILFSKKFWR